MSYCTQAEVRAMLKSDVLNQIVGDEYEEEAEREAKIAPVIDAAITDAGNEIDGYLVKRYPIPIAPVPGILNKLCKDITLYNLFSRMGITDESGEKNYLTRYEAAIKFLTLVSEGKVSVGAETGNAEAAAATGFTVSAPPRLFGRESMRGM